MSDVELAWRHGCEDVDISTLVAQVVVVGSIRSTRLDMEVIVRN